MNWADGHHQPLNRIYRLVVKLDYCHTSAAAASSGLYLQDSLMIEAPLRERSLPQLRANTHASNATRFRHQIANKHHPQRYPPARACAKYEYRHLLRASLPASRPNLVERILHVIDLEESIHRALNQQSPNTFELTNYGAGMKMITTRQTKRFR